MRAAAILCIVGVVGLAAGCTSSAKKDAGATTPAPAYQATRIATACPVGGASFSSMQDLAASKSQIEGPPTAVTVAQIRCEPSGSMVKINVELVNPSANTQRIAYKFRWFDSQGMLTFDDEAFKPVLMYQNSTRIVATQVPIEKIADFRIVVMGQTDKMP